MAVDTKAKRGSAVHVALPWRTWRAEPDGAIDDEDRLGVGGYYIGIAGLDITITPVYLAPAINRTYAAGSSARTYTAPSLVRTHTDTEE